MTTGLLVATILAIAVVAVGLYLINRWGPGVVRRPVYCPEKKVPAEVKLERKEGTFGALLNADVVCCSLFPEGAVDCGKKCIRA